MSAPNPSIGHPCFEPGAGAALAQAVRIHQRGGGGSAGEALGVANGDLRAEEDHRRAADHHPPATDGPFSFFCCPMFPWWSGHHVVIF